MITVENINKHFAENQVLTDISFVFESGKTNLIIGESGSGKTTLLKIMIGLLESDSGVVNYNGRNFTEMNFKQKKNLRKEIGMLFQGGALFDYMSVEENIIFPLNMFAEKSEEENLERVNFCLNRVNLENTNHLLPTELSGGMKKRVAIARAIINNPAILLADEPTGALDSKTTEDVLDLFDKLHESGITIVLVTHEDEVANRAKKIAKFKDGRIVELKVN